MIDPIAVVECRHSRRALPDPRVVRTGDRVPVRRRQPPVLPRVAERIRRNSERDVEPELARTRPDIGARCGHHERQIADYGDARGPGFGARRLPLRLGDPLLVLVPEHFCLRTSSRVGRGPPGRDRGAPAASRARTTARSAWPSRDTARSRRATIVRVRNRRRTPRRELSGVTIPRRENAGRRRRAPHASPRGRPRSAPWTTRARRRGAGGPQSRAPSSRPRAGSLPSPRARGRWDRSPSPMSRSTATSHRRARSRSAGSSRESSRPAPSIAPVARCPGARRVPNSMSKRPRTTAA